MGITAEAKRRRLVDDLIAAGDIRTPAVHAAFEKVPRELFVEEDQAHKAYADTPLPIPAGQTISAPSMIAIMLEEGGFAGGQKVLEVGAGSGYNAALLAELVGGENLVTIERHPELVEFARTNLAKAGYSLTVVAGDGSLGYPPNAPYDRIIATAGAPRIPKSWSAQLRVGGRILVPIGPSAFHQVLTIAEKRADGTLAVIESVACSFVPLVGKEAWRH